MSDGSPTVDADQESAALLDDDLVDALAGAVQDVFSTMVITDCDRAAIDEAGLEPRVLAPGLPVDAGSGRHEQVCFEIDTEVGIGGDLGGRVLLRCSAEGAMEIARGLLLLDDSESVDVAAAADALGECANMIAGLVKTRFFDPRGAFDLTCPRISKSPVLDGMGRAAVQAYRLRQGVIAVEIWLDEEP